MQVVMKKICCCTGHRPKGFAWDYGDKTLRAHKDYLGYLAYLLEEFINDGYEQFVCGGAIGADMNFAEAVITLRKKYPQIRLEIVVPCKNQDRKWRETDKERYQFILQQADETNVLFSRYTPWCYDKRNKYMVDKSNLVLVVWNGTKTGGTYQTKKYAEKKGKELEYVMLPPKDADLETQFHFFIENGVPLEERKRKRERIKKVLEMMRKNEEE